MGRKATEPDYGLPPLTFAEAARVLGIREGDLMAWVMERARPSMSQWSEWTRATRPIPEKIIRLYLTSRGAAAAAATPPDGGIVSPPAPVPVGRGALQRGGKQKRA